MHDTNRICVVPARNNFVLTGLAFSQAPSRIALWWWFFIFVPASTKLILNRKMFHRSSQNLNCANRLNMDILAFEVTRTHKAADSRDNRSSAGRSDVNDHSFFVINEIICTWTVCRYNYLCYWLWHVLTFIMAVYLLYLCMVRPGSVLRLRYDQSFQTKFTREPLPRDW